MKRFRLPLFLLAFFLIASGCDSNGGDDDDNDPSHLLTGSSSVNITGVHTGSAAGTGVASSSNLSPGWGIIMGAAEASTAGFVIASETGSRPGSGTYTIADGTLTTLPSGQYRGTLSVAGELFVSSSGTLTITESAAGSVEGSFTFTAVGVLDNSRSITVSGSFNSNNSDFTSG